MRDGVRVLGVEPGGGAGTAVEVVPDVDGDGIDDLWLSAAEAGATASRGGAAYLLLGPIPADTTVEAAVLTLRGDVDDRLGTAVHGVGDIDGDGVTDLGAGAPGDSILGPVVTKGAGPGRVVVISGATRGTASVADALLVGLGEVEGDKAGSSVGAGGDLDGDGLGEVLVGAYMHAGGARLGGAAYVLAGRSGVVALADADARLLGTLEGEQAGASVRGIGDVDGDGYGDLLVGADGDEAGRPGRAYLVGGPVAGEAALADVAAAIIDSSQDEDNLGSTALGGRDLTGDGLADVVLCAYDAVEEGEAVGASYVLAGPLSGAILAQEAAHTVVRGLLDLAHSGESCAIAPDVDGDGTAELLLGAHVHGVDQEGRGYLFYDLPGGELRVDEADATFLGSVPDEDVGWSVAGGDLGGDGHAEVVIGARKLTEDQPSQGAVFVVPGGPR